MDIFSFSRFEKFSATISLYKISASFSSPYESPMMGMLGCLILSCESQAIDTLVHPVFFLLLWASSTALFLSWLTIFSSSSSLLLKLSVYFSVQLLSSSPLFDFYLVFYYSSHFFFEVLCSSILLPSLVSIFITLTLSFLSGTLLNSISFFWSFILFFIGMYASVSSFGLTLCVGF